MRNIDFDRRLFSGNFYHVMRYMSHDDVRYIFAYGGSSSGKTYGIVQAVLISTLKDAKNTLVFRKVLASIRKTIFNDFKTAIAQLKLTDMFVIQDLKIKCFNGGVIDFLGCDDPEKIKGIAGYQRIIVDELTELEIDDWMQLRKRMRGVKGQKCVCTFNPVSSQHWIKTTIFDSLNWKDIPTTFGKVGDTVTEAKQDYSNRYVALRSTYLNNPYVVGGIDDKGNKYGYVDQATIDSFEEDKKFDENYYRIYALGNWGVLKSGAEFYHKYIEKKHMKRVELDITKAIWLSIDENVVPYLSMLVCQFIDGEFRIIDEITAMHPDNNLPGLAKILVSRYPDITKCKLFLTGDSTSKKRDVKIGANQNLFTIMKDELSKVGFDDVTIRILQSNPPQIQSGLLMNKLFAEQFAERIAISNRCEKLSLDLLSVKTADDGGILKEYGKTPGKDGYKYEKYGHLSDCMRYFIHNTEKGKELFSKLTHKGSNFDTIDVVMQDEFML